jgi:hypothetical protein
MNTQIDEYRHAEIAQDVPAQAPVVLAPDEFPLGELELCDWCTCSLAYGKVVTPIGQFCSDACVDEMLDMIAYMSEPHQERRMATNMTPQQMQTFVQAAQAGIACGLSHPLEWFSNAYEMISHGPWIDQASSDIALTDAFVAFYRGTDCQPDDPVANLDHDGLRKMLEQFYQKEKCYACYRPFPPREPAHATEGK